MSKENPAPELGHENFWDHHKAKLPDDWNTEKPASDKTEDESK
jgi:hypothetical protein